MAGETPITIVGNLTADPELRYTPSGVAVANFTVASTPRTYDRQSGEWKDSETLFMRCSVWRNQAENVTESLRQGNRVVVVGRLVSRSFQDRDGNSRTTTEVQADEIAGSCRNATVVVNKIVRTGGAQLGNDDNPRRSDATEDPWASAPPVGSAQGEEPPF